MDLLYSVSVTQETTENWNNYTLFEANFPKKPATFDKDFGKLTWNIELAPKAKKVIEFSYSADWPRQGIIPRLGTRVAEGLVVVVDPDGKPA